MPKIDLKTIVANKVPKVARYIPNCVINWLRKVLHEDQVNEILDRYWDLPPQAFIHGFFDYMKISYAIEGLEKIDPTRRYIFVSNHPFGGMDGLMLADKLMDHFGDVRVVVNDLLMNVEPLRPLWIPVNKHGAQSASYARQFDEAFAGDVPILTFPSGLCSRCKNGIVSDLAWKTNFLKRAAATGREVVPIFVEGHLSRFFYRLANLRERLGIKFNIEMLFLSDEMFQQQGQHFRIRVGEPISIAQLQKEGSLPEQAEYVRKKTYLLKKELHKEA
ncbi:MAG: 1-acyl-sn-glycerol-3-phosphate acyltransferase [Alistipes sp.]